MVGGVGSSWNARMKLKQLHFSLLCDLNVYAFWVNFINFLTISQIYSFPLVITIMCLCVWGGYVLNHKPEEVSEDSMFSSSNFLCVQEFKLSSLDLDMTHNWHIMNIHDG